MNVLRIWQLLIAATRCSQFSQKPSLIIRFHIIIILSIAPICLSSCLNPNQKENKANNSDISITINDSLHNLRIAKQRFDLFNNTDNQLSKQYIKTLNKIKEYEINKWYLYSSMGGGNDSSELKLMRINDTDLLFLYTSLTAKGKISVRDTVTINPVVDCYLVYRFGYLEDQYILTKKSENTITILTIGEKVKHTSIAFKSKHNLESKSNHRRNLESEFDHIIKFIRRGYLEPYQEYFYNAMVKLFKYSTAEDRTALRENKKYKNLLSDVNDLVIEMSSIDSSESLKNRTYFTEVAEHFFQDHIAESLRQNGFKSVNLITSDAIQCINKDSFENLRAAIYQDAKGLVRSVRFEKFNTEKSSYSTSYSTGLIGFHYKQGISDLKEANGYYFSMLTSNEGSQVLTVYSKVDSTNLCLEQISENILAHKYGAFLLDTVLYFDNRYYLFGKSTGGDQGDNWGNIWIKEWKGSREFKYLLNEEWYTVYQGEDFGGDKRIVSYEFVDSLMIELKIETKENLYDSSEYEIERYLIDTLSYK